MLAALYAAAKPAPVRVLGVQLRQFSAGHLLLLMAHDVAFVRGKPPELSDLMTAVLICSNTWESYDALIADPDFSRDLIAWRKKLLHRSTWNKLRRKPPYDLSAAFRLFVEYLKAGLERPCLEFDSSNARELRIPDVMLTITTLMSELGQDFSTAINQSMPWSRWIVASWGVQRGHLEIVDRKERLDDQKDADEYAARVVGTFEDTDGIS